MIKSYRYLDLITALFVMVLIVSNITSVKITQIGPLTFDGGTILFPLAYIFGDVLTEVYGFHRARRVIWTGFALLAFTVLIFALVDALPPAPGWEMQTAFSQVLGVVPRIAAASLLAYLAGEFVNSVILARLKVATAGRHLWVRTIASTLFGQGVDTGLFVVIAFAGTMPGDVLWSIIVSNYLFKVGVEVLFTPVTYAVVNTLKRLENEDFYDDHTRFSVW